MDEAFMTAPEATIGTMGVRFWLDFTRYF